MFSVCKILNKKKEREETNYTRRTDKFKIPKCMNPPKNKRWGECVKLIYFSMWLKRIQI